LHKSLGPEPILKIDFHGGLGDIPTKLLQPVPELKVDITSIETINPEWASVIPPRLLQKQLRRSRVKYNLVVSWNRRSTRDVKYILYWFLRFQSRSISG
jgi:hypothetical protein